MGDNQGTSATRVHASVETLSGISCLTGTDGDMALRKLEQVIQQSVRKLSEQKKPFHGGITLQLQAWRKKKGCVKSPKGREMLDLGIPVVVKKNADAEISLLRLES